MKRLVLLIALIGFFAAFFFLGGPKLLSFQTLQAEAGALRALAEARPLLFAGGYFAVYLLVTGLSLPGAAVLTLAGGALFGFAEGLVLVSFASALGAVLACALARSLFRPLVSQRFQSQLAVINEGLARDGVFYLLSLRLVPVVPFFVVNLVFGLTRLPLRQFYWVSQLGMLPGTVVYVLAGTELGALTGPQDILSPPLLLALGALGLFPWLARGLLAVLARGRALRGFARPRRFDDNVIVIGGGSGGLIAALVAATARAEVTLVERDAMGGDCLNRGCVPSKALLSAAHLAAAQRRGRAGVRSLGVEVNFAEVMEQVHSAIATIEPKDSAERYEGLGVKVLKGSATLVDPWTVEVNGARRTARAIILATGGEPLVPPIPGLEDCDPLTSDTLWQLTEAPERCLVLGAGPIGCELAQSLAALGSSVTLVDQASQVLPREDDAVGAVVAEALEAEGLSLRLGAKAEAFTPGGAPGSGTLTLADGETLPFDRVLVAVGRRPVTEGLGLDALGVARLPNGALDVDETLRASIPTIYGCGDVVGPYQFTHMASDQAGVAALNALFRPLKAFKWTGAVVPWVTFTAPEVARVGLSEREAQEKSLAVTVTRVGYDDNDRAIAEGETAGFIQVLTPPGKDRILGVTIVGARAGELLAPWVLAMTHGLGLKKIMGTIHAYPTYAELNKAVASAWRKAHAPEKALDLLRHWHGLWR